jgi:hypothetical protein
MQRIRIGGHSGPSLIAFIISFGTMLLLSVFWVPNSFSQAGALNSLSASGQGPAGPPSAGPQLRTPQEPRRSEEEVEMERKREKAKKKQDYEDTKKLTEQLLKTVQELKESIDKAGEDTLPVNALRKTEEIDSLSKKIKAKLKGMG